jgi:putative acetyltransferase
VSGDVTIRAAVPDDGAAIMAVHVASILGLGQGYHTRAELESWAAGLAPEFYGRAMVDDGERFEVACDEGGRILAFSSWKDDEVWSLYVHPDAARRGLGSLLLRRVEAAVAANGHASVRISASCPGRLFYERHGYRVVREKDWTTRGGLAIGTLDMEKAL